MTTTVERKLSKFMFPVSERKIYTEDFLKGRMVKAPDYKAIFREDKNRLIAITKASYKLVPNADLIDSLMTELDRLTTSWRIDPSHTFVSDARMRIQITFPEISISDGRSEISLSLYLSNSYDQSESVKAYLGSLRVQCGNGAVYGHIMAKFFHRHTEGFRIRNLKEQIEQAYDKMPEVKRRIEVLKRLEVTDEIRSTVEEKLGKGIAKYSFEEHPPVSQWGLYNILTYYISHIVKQHMRFNYQYQVSKLFHL